MNMFARFDENPAITLQDIKKAKRYGRRTDAHTHRQRENSIPTTNFTNKVCRGGGGGGGINIKIWKSHLNTGGKPRNYHEIVLTQICSQATSGTRRVSFQAENWIKKGCVTFIFVLFYN